MPSISFAIISLVIASTIWIYVRMRTPRHSCSPANIPGPKSQSWWKGNFKEAFNANAWDFHERLLKEYGPVSRIDGLMGDQQLVIFDPGAMYHILVKDQVVWPRTNVASSRLVFGKGLTSIDGEAHRKQRKALNPVFSIAHMREMLPIFYDVIHKLERGLSSKFTTSGSRAQEIELLSWISRTALELIGQAGLGYSFDNLADETATHPYTGILKDLQVVTGEMRFFRAYILPIIMDIGTPGFRRWILELTPWKNGHRVKDMSDYMWNLSQEVYAGKKKALEQGDEVVARQVGKGKDIMSILMKMNLNADGADKLDDDEVLGQMSVFIFAAMDTTSGALARILHLLSTRPEVQDRLRQELLEAQHDGKDVPHDVLVTLPYLDAVCRETLRLFPPVSHIFRAAAHNTILPLLNPVVGIDGTTITELHIPKNTGVLVSVLNSNRNSAIWGPDAQEWKPERWLSPLPEALLDARIPGVYSHLMTFNAGGRSCIGFKFSQLEMKAVLSMLISEFKFSPSDKEVVWQMNAITTPSLKGDKRPQMPLVVTKVSG